MVTGELNKQQNRLLLISCLYAIGQLYVFTDSVHNRERTCIDNDVLQYY
jgi:hypothetical protein